MIKSTRKNSRCFHVGPASFRKGIICKWQIMTVVVVVFVVFGYKTYIHCVYVLYRQFYAGSSNKLPHVKNLGIERGRESGKNKRVRNFPTML